MSNTHDIEQDDQITVSGSQSKTHRITVPSGESATFRGRVTDKWGRTSSWSDPVTATSQSESTVQRLGLHVTAQELAIWRDRWVNNPGDAFVNARIDQEKTRVTNNRNTVNNNPGSHLWSLATGLVTNDGKFSGHDGSGLSTQRQQSARLRDAAFHALMTQDSTMMNTIGGLLHQQPDQPNCDFATNSGWALPPAIQMRNAMTPGFVVSHPMVTFVHAYDYFKIAVTEGWATDITSAQHTKIRNWLRAWADYNVAGWLERIEQAMNRDTGVPNTTNVWSFQGYTTMYDNSPTNYAVYDRYNNRAFSCIRAIGLIGIVLEDAPLMAEAHQSLREFLDYAFIPEGAVADTSRMYAGFSPGAAYPALQASHMATPLDALARYSADYNLFSYTTNNSILSISGQPNKVPENPETARSFQFFFRHLVRYANRTYDRYSAGVRIDYRDPNNGSNRGMHDRFIQMGLAYPDDQLLKDWYRGENGNPTWTIGGNGHTDLNDSWAFAAPYLQWAGLEGQVWPYPGVSQP